jgi:hypothetical protein
MSRSFSWLVYFLFIVKAILICYWHFQIRHVLTTFSKVLFIICLQYEFLLCSGYSPIPWKLRAFIFLPPNLLDILIQPKLTETFRNNDKFKFAKILLQLG